jgi:hypothetical protein
VLLKIFIAAILVLIANTADAKNLETICNQQDCFKNGWITTEPGTDYLLKCECIDGDCENVGWKSVDNRGSTFIVRCKSGGCFVDGWRSLQNDQDKILIDLVTCKEDNCLTYGWSIFASYDKGGEVTCKRDDCRRFGGFSNWRKEHSETNCINGDCYRYGWTADIED